MGAEAIIERETIVGEKIGDSDVSNVGPAYKRLRHVIPILCLGGWSAWLQFATCNFFCSFLVVLHGERQTS